MGLGLEKLERKSGQAGDFWAFELKENVTSKGGTTEAAFEILEGSKKNFYNLLKSAIKNAVKRSKELSN